MQGRLQKFISQAGVASRRHAEALIKAGQVKVNGQVVTKLGSKVDPDQDKVYVQGKRIHIEKKMYLAFYKPKRCLTTRNDPRKRKTVYDFLPEKYKNTVWPIGRLDFNTEGLLLLTNDGELTQKLSHPSFEHEKEYEVLVDREVSEGKLIKLKSGITLGEKITSPAKIKTDGKKIYITIHEGINRQVRRMFGALSITVRNLKRIRVGKYKLKDLNPGEYKEIKKDELI